MALTAFAWCIVAVRGRILHEPYPRNTLFFIPQVRFTDFTDFTQRVAHFGEPNMLVRTDIRVQFPYPVPTIYAFLAFVCVTSHSLRAYLIFVLLSFLLATCFFSLRVSRATPKKLPQLAIWSTLIVGFPLQFLVDRGNIEGVIWVLILLGAVAYIRNRTVISAIVWGLAASMKIFPGLLFALFLARRKFGTFAVGVAATVAFSLLALAGIGPTIHQAAADSSKSAGFLMENYIIPDYTGGFDHSLFEGIKHVIFVAKAFNKDPAVALPISVMPVNRKALRVYNVVIPLAGILLYWFRLRRLPLLNQFIAYIVFCVLLPYVSGDYTLVHVYIAWGAFLLFLISDVATGRASLPGNAISSILISCAVTFVPLSYLLIGTFAFGSQIKTVALIVILVTVLRFPMPSSLFGDLQLSREVAPIALD